MSHDQQQPPPRRDWQSPPSPPPLPGQQTQLQPYAVPMPVETNGLAIVSLVCSILGWFGLFGIGGIIGVVVGHTARRQILASMGRQGGDGIAQAGIIIGYINIGLAAIGLCCIGGYFFMFMVLPLLFLSGLAAAAAGP